MGHKTQANSRGSSVAFFWSRQGWWKVYISVELPRKADPKSPPGQATPSETVPTEVGQNKRPSGNGENTEEKGNSSKKGHSGDAQSKSRI